MLFVGDVAIPDDLPVARGLWPVACAGPVVANLEGALAPSAAGLLGRRVVFNGPSVLGYLRHGGVRAVSLANNHVMDCPDRLGDTIRLLADRGIACCGAGPDARTAAEPAVLMDGETPVVLLAFGWEPIGCWAAGPARSGVNPMRTRHVLQSVAHSRAASSEARIVLLMHWNFEMEAYPQPAHRRLARAAIDAGASAIIGCHPHCVQGIELYKGAPIVYSLGNWLFPHGRFWGGTLRFPPYTARQLAFEWDAGTGRSTCHWCTFDACSGALQLEISEPLDASPRVEELTPFRHMNENEYNAWFRRHRRKRVALPVYTDPFAFAPNAMRDALVGIRQRAIDALVAMGLKRGRR